MLRTTISLGRAASARLVPGIALCVCLAIIAVALQFVEQQLLGYPVVEALVIALLLGAVWRNTWGLSPPFVQGVHFVARPILELTIVLLGASVNLPTVIQAGPTLVLFVLAAVAVGIAAGAGMGRLLGLNPKLALLVGIGNAICGNSAIAAVAPVIEADDSDVASAIGLTAILGVAMVLLLPLLVPLFELTHYQYGVLAGMTVYAVPQVLAATFPVSSISGQVGTLVKLVRVLLLGPVVLCLSLACRGRKRSQSPGVFRLVPWFVTGFWVMAAANSAGLISPLLSMPISELSRALMVVAMAALGLGVDARAVRRVGPAVGVTVVVSLGVLAGLSLLLIRLLMVGSD
jgi:uncharacterized integral membrane protein (TIGR00698 family)